MGLDLAQDKYLVRPRLQLKSKIESFGPFRVELSYLNAWQAFKRLPVSQGRQHGIPSLQSSVHAAIFPYMKTWRKRKCSYMTRSLICDRVCRDRESLWCPIMKH